MNTYTITTNTLLLLDEPVSRRTELAAQFLPHFNYGYLKVCDDYIKPKHWEQITLGSAKEKALSALSLKFKEVSKVSLYKDGSAEANYGIAQAYPFLIVEGNLVVPQADAGASMWIEYYYRPWALTMASADNDTTATTIPSLMPEAYHEALKYFAAAKYGATRRKFGTLAPYWEQQFVAAIEDLRPPKDSVNTKFRNMFPAQPF